MVGNFSAAIAITAPTSLDTAAYGKLHIASGTGAVTLPEPVAGKVLAFYNAGASITLNGPVSYSGSDYAEYPMTGAGCWTLVANGSKWYVSSMPGIGEGQTWADDRGYALNSVYTNTTGRPITIACIVNAASNTRNVCHLYVDGKDISGQYFSQVSPASPMTTQAGVVPHGSTFQVTVERYSSFSYMTLE